MDSRAVTGNVGDSTSISPTVTATTMYERLGGMAFFESLTERFYQGVASDEVLRPMYPDDLEGPRRHLCLFLAQFWGGPRTYDDERGSPRLRARHLPFKVNRDARDRWLAHMRAAVEEAHLGALEKAQLINYFEAAANHMVNTPDD
jgi:hemoglobin